MFKKNFKLLISTLFLILVLCSPFFVFSANGAGTALNKLQNVGTQSGYSEADETTLATTLGIIVSAVLSLLGIVFIILIIYGGILWMTAIGKENQVEKAKNIIIQAVIGLVIVLAAYAITSFIGNQLTGSNSPTSTTSEETQTPIE